MLYVSLAYHPGSGSLLQAQLLLLPVYKGKCMVMQLLSRQAY